MAKSASTVSIPEASKQQRKPKVYVTRKFFDEPIDLLKTVADVEVFEGEDDPIPRELLKEKVAAGIDGLLPMLTDRIDCEIMDADAGKNQLKVISNYAVGYNNIDVTEATKRGLMVTNTPEVLDDSTADVAFMLMMATARRLVEVDKYVRDCKWTRAWGPKMLLGTDVSNKTLGIIGMGRIGSKMISRAKGFNMNIIYNKTNRLSLEDEKGLGVEYREFDDLLRESDFISLHVPLNENTQHLISTRELKLMKPTSFLINTARGPIIDEKALIAALQEKWIAGAGLDVHYNEPIVDPENHPLLKLDNVTVLPHIGSATVETRLAMAMRAATNMVAALKGETPKDLVNPDALK